MRAFYNNIGLVYYKLRDNKKAIYYFSKAISTILYDSRIFEESLMYSNLGLAYGEMGQFATAKGLIGVGLDSKSSEDVNSLLAGYFALGQVMLRQGNLEASDTLLRKTLAIATSESESRYAAESLVLLATIKLKRHAVMDAFTLLKKCESECLRFGYKEILLNCYRNIGSCLEIMGNYPLLAKYQKAIVELSNSLHSHEVLDMIYAFELDLRRTHNNLLLANQNEGLRLQDKIIKTKTFEYYGLAIFCLLLALLIVLIYRFCKEKRAIYERLIRLINERDSTLTEFNRVRFESASETIGQVITKLTDLATLMTRAKFLTSDQDLRRRLDSSIIEINEVTQKLTTFQ
jgi:tetratricopeptide (TPR) repeat protein